MPRAAISETARALLLASLAGVCFGAMAFFAKLGIGFLDEPATALGLAGSAATIGSILAVVAIQATPRAVE